MIKHFRNLRAGLLDKKQLRKYLFYALSEIVLVIIGILVAIQVDNWNNDRKERNQLHATLDQVYTVFDRDLDRFISLRTGYEKQIAMIDSILVNPKGIRPELLPFMLYYIDLGYESLSTEVTNLVQDLNLNPDDVRQRNLAKAISEYERNFNVTSYFVKKYITQLLQQQKLPQPSLIFQTSDQGNFQNVDLSLFDEEEIKLVWELLDNPSLRRALKSARNEKVINNQILEFNIGIIKSKKIAIKDYYPDVVLLYRTIGLIGDGTETNNWEQDVDLVPTDQVKAIWEGDVTLRDGFVKFREGDDWTINWGGKGFPEGNTIWYGDNIKVYPGRYHVVFNLSDRTYKFSKWDQ